MADDKLGGKFGGGAIENIGGGFIPGGKFSGGNLEKSMVGGIAGRFGEASGTWGFGAGADIVTGGV